MCCAEVVRVAGAYDTPAPSAEPVAWMYTTQHSDGRRYLTRYQPDLSTYKADTVWPLYTTPPDHTALLRQALDALGHFDDVDKTDAAIDALRAALAKEPK
jgi:hypothetical protein